VAKLERAIDLFLALISSIRTMVLNSIHVNIVAMEFDNQNIGKPDGKALHARCKVRVQRMW
jgi:hypothetical protein